MSHICEEIVSAAKYLRENEMSNQHLRALHHAQKRPETFSSTIKYFGANKELKGLNVLYANRLLFVADAHRKGLTGFQSLVDTALAKWPV
jgi:hypothetical protein